jgi:hypothetical protein
MQIILISEWICEACRSVGMWHCSDPEHCGNMKKTERK